MVVKIYYAIHGIFKSMRMGFLSYHAFQRFLFFISHALLAVNEKLKQINFYYRTVVILLFFFVSLPITIDSHRFWFYAHQRLSHQRQYINSFHCSRFNPLTHTKCYLMSLYFWLIQMNIYRENASCNVELTEIRFICFLSKLNAITLWTKCWMNLLNELFVEYEEQCTKSRHFFREFSMQSINEIKKTGKLKAFV